MSKACAVLSAAAFIGVFTGHTHQIVIAVGAAIVSVIMHHFKPVKL